MTPSESREKMIRMATDVDKEIKSKNPPPPDKTPEELLLDRTVAMEQAAAYKFRRQMKLRIDPMTRQEFLREYYKVLRQELNNLSKDEFATVACMLIAMAGMKQFRDELI